MSISDKVPFCLLIDAFHELPGINQHVRTHSDRPREVAIDLNPGLTPEPYVENRSPPPDILIARFQPKKFIRDGSIFYKWMLIN